MRKKVNTGTTMGGLNMSACAVPIGQILRPHRRTRPRIQPPYLLLELDNTRIPPLQSPSPHAYRTGTSRGSSCRLRVRPAAQTAGSRL